MDPAESIEAKRAVLFTAMLGIFGQLWRNKYGEDDDEVGTWSHVLSGLSMRQIEGGVRMIRESWESEYPPTPARFRKWAMDSVRPYDAAPQERRLEQLPADEATARHHLDQMRAMLRGAA